jgi:tetratricopeptide (TPR) repeat protein
MPAGDPSTLKARFNALADLRRWEDAVRVGLDWLAVDPDSSDAHAHQAWAYLKCHDLEAADHHAREAISQAPNWSWPPRLLAHVKAGRDQWNEALHLALESLRCDPEDHASHTLAARCLIHLGCAEHALAHARQAVALEPEDANYRYMLQAIEYIGKSSAADLCNRIHKLNAALALEPTNVNILRELALLYGGSLGDYDQAEELLQQAVVLAPDDADVHEARERMAADRDPIFALLRLPEQAPNNLLASMFRSGSWTLEDVLALVIVGCVLLVFMVPAAVICLIPVRAYGWLVHAEFAAHRTTLAWLGDWLFRLSRLPLLVRRLLWLPVFGICVGAALWLFPWPLLLAGNLLLSLLLSLWILRRSRRKAASNRRLISQVVTADDFDGETILAEAIGDDVIRADFA